MKKVRKTSGRSAVQAENDNPFNEITDLGTIFRIHRIQRIQRIHRIVRKRWQQGQGRPPIPHAPGARMTVVYQTPSNDPLGLDLDLDLVLPGVGIPSL